jgi:hypothetical protein
MVQINTQTTSWRLSDEVHCGDSATVFGKTREFGATGKSLSVPTSFLECRLGYQVAKEKTAALSPRFSSCLIAEQLLTNQLDVLHSSSEMLQFMQRK